MGIQEGWTDEKGDNVQVEESIRPPCDDYRLAGALLQPAGELFYMDVLYICEYKANGCHANLYKKSKFE